MVAPSSSACRLFALTAWSLAAALLLTGAALAQEDDLFGDDAAVGATDTAAAPADSTAPATDAAGGEQQQQQQLTSEDVQRMLKEGDEAIRSGDYEKALSTYDLLVRVFKQQFQTQVFLPIVYTGRGQAFAGMQDYEAALADFKEALQGEPNHVPALLARGKLYLDLDQPAAELALADFQLAIEQDRRNLEALFGLGKAYVLLQGVQQAIKPLTHVVEKDDQNAEAFRLRAQANAGIGKYPEAHADIEKSLSIDPDNYETYFALGTILLREELYAEAAQAFEDAIVRYKPKDPESTDPFAQGYLTKAATLIEAGKKAESAEARNQAYEAALAECDKLMEMIGDAPIYATIRAATEYRRGVCLRLLGRYGDAIVALTEAINLNPDLAEAYFRRGICFYYIGEDHLAIADFKQAGNIEYQDPRPRLWEGFAYAKLGNYHEALRAYGQALAESDRYVPAYVNRGLAYMMLGENEKALADFNAAVRLEPTEWTHYFKRGMAHQRLGDHQRAADSFVNAVRFYGDYPPAYRRAAESLTVLGRTELAKEYTSKADELEAEQKAMQEKEATQP